MTDESGGTVIRALMIDDDERAAQLTARYLTAHGVVTRYEVTASLGLDEALRGRYDVILLDVMLPGRDGVEVCRSLRLMSDVPVIMLTACWAEADRVLGLESGADDYMTKPISMRELLARVRAVVRRAQRGVAPITGRLRLNGLTLDPGNLHVEVNGVAVSLSSFEFSLLYALAERAGRVLSREQLLILVQGSAEEAFVRSNDIQIFSASPQARRRPAPAAVAADGPGCRLHAGQTAAFAVMVRYLDAVQSSRVHDVAPLVLHNST
ncbi:response regulator transcription factor [Nannocystis pusilla]|uniref:response regulator transcription factor n=1 Tax=Nannocystis pusilla TaxID=889268 RepID=UPI003DA5FC57